MGTAWPNRVYDSKFLPNIRIDRQADMLSLDGFSLGNIFARQQSIVGPISNGKEACVVVFPTVLLVLVHGPLQHCYSGLRQVGKPHYFCLCRVDHMSVWSRMCLPIIGNSSLVNLNELNYNGGYFPGIQRPGFHMYHNRLSVHEPSMSIYQAYDLLY